MPDRGEFRQSDLRELDGRSVGLASVRAKWLTVGGAVARDPSVGARRSGGKIERSSALAGGLVSVRAKSHVADRSEAGGSRQ